MTPATFDPADIAAIRDGLIEHLSPTLGAISVAEGPVRFTSGLDTFVYAVTLGGTIPAEWAVPLVLRIYPSMDQHPKAEREFAIQKFVVGTGVPGAGAVARRRIRRAVGTAVYDHGASTGLPRHRSLQEPAGHRRHGQARWQPFRPDCTRSRRTAARFRTTARWSTAGSKRHRNASPSITRRGLMNRCAGWKITRELVRNEEPVLTHNDFHPLNLIVDGDRMTLLDWPDAALGDRHCDVARTLALFWLAPALERSFLGRTALRTLRGFIVRRYEKAYAIAPAAGSRADPLLAGAARLQRVGSDRHDAAGRRGGDRRAAGCSRRDSAGPVQSLRRYFEQRAV